ncbi:MAG: hypothetical protein LUD72_12960 [Bacteroidales bacterium]|nr:hypothetical protein [Bacteroidales bacterium]
MYSKGLPETLLASLTAYFERLGKAGYMRYDRTCELLALTLVNSFLNGQMSVYVTESDYRTIGRFIAEVTGRNCMVPWQEYSAELPQVGGPMQFVTNYLRGTARGETRVAEDGTLRKL